MEQKERLQYLTEEFIKDSPEYKNMPVPSIADEQKQVLRSLMNIRMPRPMASHVLKVQDEYLRERSRENGIVTMNDIPVCRTVGNTGISIWQGDITRLAADAIVNAANSQMLGCFVPMHMCIDNCIHTYAGIQLRAECAQKMRALRLQYGNDYEQPTAVPMLTKGYNLPASHVIHVTGPIVSRYLTRELEQQLADCYVNVLDMCAENGLRSAAFCCISTGVFRFPNDRAADIAVGSVTQWISDHPCAMDRVVFNVFKDLDRDLYTQRLSGGEQ